MAEPWAAGTPPETEWSATTWTVGTECIRASLNRVYKCVVARAPSNTVPPESDPIGWLEIRPTAIMVPFGPYTNASGQSVFKRLATSTTSENIVFSLGLRYPDSIALFGLAGSLVRVRLFSTVGGVQVGSDIVRYLIRGSAGQWDRRFGERSYRDRLLITGLPRYPNCELRISIEAGTGQLRRVSHIQVGKLRFIPGGTFGGTEYGATNSINTKIYISTDADGTETRTLYGTSQDMQGRVVFEAGRDSAVISMLRRLAGRCVAAIPSLEPRYEQRLTLGVFDTAPAKADNYGVSSIDFSLKGMPVDPAA